MRRRLPGVLVPVEQTAFWRPEDHPLGPSRGNCLAACVASIFEIPITQALSTGTGLGQDLMRWTSEQYPALRCSVQHLADPTANPCDMDEWRSWPALGSVSHQGYWIAGVYSYRIPDEMMTGCACTDRVPGGDPDCEHCNGRPDERKLGILWGLHAVVMKDSRLAWDPHPRRADGVGPIQSKMSWHVVDPAKL